MARWRIGPWRVPNIRRDISQQLENGIEKNHKDRWPSSGDSQSLDRLEWNGGVLSDGSLNAWQIRLK
jgi:hypothetical protein